MMQALCVFAEGLWCSPPARLSLSRRSLARSLYRPLRQQDGVRDSRHWLAAAANLPQGDAEKDSPEHPVRVLPPRVRRPPLGDAHWMCTFNLTMSWFSNHQGSEVIPGVSLGGRAVFLLCIFCQKVCIDSFHVFPSVFSKFHLSSYLFVYVTTIFPALPLPLVSVCC